VQLEHGAVSQDACHAPRYGRAACSLKTVSIFAKPTSQGR